MNTSKNPSSIGKGTKSGQGANPATHPGSGFQPFPSSLQPLGTAATQKPTSLPGASAPEAKPAPLPTRPKGRFFMGTLFLLGLTVAGSLVWNTFFAYDAYGTIQGRVLEVSAPWEGVVRTVHVRAGQFVRQDDLLMTLENLELRQRLEALADEQRLAQATLEAEIAQLTWQVQARHDQTRKASAEYYELWGELLQANAKLADLKQKLVRTTAAEHALPADHLAEVTYATQGQEAKVQKLQAAVTEMKERLGQEHPEIVNVPDQIKPYLIRIEALQAERRRLRDVLLQGQVRAPMNGRVVRTQRYAGEYAEVAEPLVEILEDASLEAVIYIPQHRADQYHIGHEVLLSVEPHGQQLVFTVTRLGDLFEAPPKNVSRYYRAEEKLLPVHASRAWNPAEGVVLRLGSEVKMPRCWYFPFL